MNAGNKVMDDVILDAVNKAAADIDRAELRAAIGDGVSRMLNEKIATFVADYIEDNIYEIIDQSNIFDTVADMIKDSITVQFKP